MLKMGVRYQVGDGSNIRIWKDPWMPLPHSFRPFFPAMETTEDMMVEELIDVEAKEWMIFMLKELFSKEEVEIIARIPLSLRQANDRLVWHFDKKGLFSVKSAYHMSCSVGYTKRASSSVGGS